MLDIEFLGDSFPFEPFDYVIPLPLASVVSADKLAVDLIGAPL